MLRIALMLSAISFTVLLVHDHGKSAFLRRFQDALDQTDTILFEVDSDSKIIYVSDPIYHMLGWRNTELIGKSLHTIMPSAYIDAHDRAVSRRMNSKEPPRVSVVVSYALHRNGAVIPMRTRIYLSNHKTCFAVMNRANDIVVKEDPKNVSL